MVTMNFGALGGVEKGAGKRDGLAGMRASFAQIASDPAMFGDVPNAGAASAALERAALNLLVQLERAGRTVENIRKSAAKAAGIGEEADADARRVLSEVVVQDVTNFDDLMEAAHPSVLRDQPTGGRPTGGSGR